MINRNIDWFFQAPPVSEQPAFILPAYVELYYQLFIDNFTGNDELERRMSFLVYLVTTGCAEKLFSDVYHDAYIVNLLNTVHNVEGLIIDDVTFSNFHWHYYITNKSKFTEWGFSDSGESLSRLLVWFYTWGREAIPGEYFKMTAAPFLRPSVKYQKKNFEVTKIIEMIIDSTGYKRNIDPVKAEIELNIEIIRIFFHYASTRYPLTKFQLSQLANEAGPSAVFYELLHLYSVSFDPNILAIPVCDLDINPELKTKLLNQEVSNIKHDRT